MAEARAAAGAWHWRLVDCLRGAAWAGRRARRQLLQLMLLDQELG